MDGWQIVAGRRSWVWIDRPLATVWRWRWRWRWLGSSRSPSWGEHAPVNSACGLPACERDGCFSLRRRVMALRDGEKVDRFGGSWDGRQSHSVARTGVRRRGWLLRWASPSVACGSHLLTRPSLALFPRLVPTAVAQRPPSLQLSLTTAMTRFTTPNISLWTALFAASWTLALALENGKLHLHSALYEPRITLKLAFH